MIAITHTAAAVTPSRAPTDRQDQRRSGQWMHGS